MDDLFHTIGEKISPDELKMWRELLAFVYPVETIDQWDFNLREQLRSGYSVLKCLGDDGLIRADDTRLLKEMVAFLHRADGGLMAEVEQFTAAQQKGTNSAKQSDDPLEQLIHRIAFKEKLGRHWKSFARGGLRLSPSDMDELDHRAQHHRLTLCCLADEAMQLWRKREGSAASADVILNALESSGQKLIADKIRKTPKEPSL